METVHINTSYNVAVHYEVADIVSRGFAVVLDWLLLVAYTIALYLLIDELDASPPAWEKIIIFGFPWTFYGLLCEVFMNGRSFGKLAMRIRVARLDGGEPGPGNYLLRWVLMPIDAFFFLGAVVILFNGKGQRLGDLAAGTTVISLKQRLRLDDMLMASGPPDHQVTFPEVVRLNDEHARLIKQVLASRIDARSRLVLKLAVRLRDELAISTELPPEPFLRTLLEDYVFLTSR